MSVFGKSSTNYLWLKKSILGSVPIALVILVVGIITALIGNRVYIIIVSQLVVMMILTLGFQIFTGNSGVISYGHVGFMAIGAYASAILTIPPSIKESFLPGLPTFIATHQIGFVPAMLIALALAALVSYIIGIPMVRMSSLEAGGPIVTFAFLIVIEVILSGWQGVTGGRRALYGVPNHAHLGWMAAMAILVLLIARIYRDSPSGVMLRASREDEVAARAMGVNLERVRLGSWVLSSVLSALSGVLLGHYIGVFSPNQFYLAATVSALAMLIVGGMTTTSGAFIGAVIITIVSEVTRAIETWTGVSEVVPDLFGLSQVFIAIFFLIGLYVKPGGITGRWEIDEWYKGISSKKTLKKSKSETQI